MGSGFSFEGAPCYNKLIAMNIYNSLSRRKEDLPAPTPETKTLRLFVCGPTVYDSPHIGNARTFLVFDIFARYLRSRGVKLFYLQNITDVDDKIINRAKTENTDWKTISRRYEKIFKSNMKRLGITTVDKYARATDFIPQIVAQVKRLTEKKHAYLIEGDGYYFDLKTFPEYGKLAGRTIEQAEDATSRIDTNDKKRNRGDFALWKLSREGEPGWKSEFGFGRPGWHIEDTAITEKFFGPQYEIHGGALDLKFPHHEAEIAQQESVSEKKPFVKIWMHAGFLFVGGKKMSKSLGNFITIEDFLRDNPPEVLRWMVLNHHYRSPMDYTPELLAQSRASLEKIREFVEKLKFASKRKLSPVSSRINPGKSIVIAQKKFYAAMDDDLNTPLAVANLFELMLEFQEKIWQLDPNGAKMLVGYVESIIKMLGISLKSPKIPRNVASLAKRRETFRASKQFIQSDALRKEADALGFIIEDTPRGPFVWPKGK
jgi:cysteinyl-tRNA synthetase